MELRAKYGKFFTPCTVFVVESRSSLGTGFWYAIEGSLNVNFTLEPIDTYRDLDLETLDDLDHFTASQPIESYGDLVEEVEK